MVLVVLKAGEDLIVETRTRSLRPSIVWGQSSRVALCSMRKVEAKFELVRSSMALVKRIFEKAFVSVIASLMTMANRRVGLSALLGV